MFFYRLAMAKQMLVFLALDTRMKGNWFYYIFYKIFIG